MMINVTNNQRLRKIFLLNKKNPTQIQLGRRLKKQKPNKNFPCLFKLVKPDFKTNKITTTIVHSAGELT